MDEHRMISCEYDLGSVTLSYLKRMATQRSGVIEGYHHVYLHPEDFRRWRQAILTKGYDMRRFRIRHGWAIRAISDSWLVDAEYKRVT